MDRRKSETRPKKISLRKLGGGKAADHINVRRLPLGRMLAAASEFPADYASGLPRVLLAGDGEITVDGCRGLLLYEETRISADCGGITLEICGAGLTLTGMSENELRARGKIARIEIVERGDKKPK